ncbi:MAG: inosine monophosphate cyclohydrolase [Ktedonobacteraceae bacterium]|nr:inosine monophosphate cyclohydrolase [Ktedonobacteraceae bacterium]
MTTIATANLDTHLRDNPYPGRGLIIGRSSSLDAWFIVYWIMGRSTQSRNRKFVAVDGTLRTEPVDASLVTDPSLIIYDAMLELPDVYIVSNGDQTRSIYDELRTGGKFETALAKREHEPDAPHYTPRISGMLDFRSQEPAIALSILKANPLDPQRTDRFTYRPASPSAGFGVGLTTYNGDGSPLPSFQGDPLLLPLKGDSEEVLHTYWEALNAENRIALAVKQVPFHGGVSELKVLNSRK